MKKIILSFSLFLIGATSIAQNLTEITNLRLYEHHSSIVNNGLSFGWGTNGSQSGYDFVNHTYYSSFPGSNAQIGYVNGEEINLDLVETNGPVTANVSFSFTSGNSNLGQGVIGNGITEWVLAPSGFNYNGINDVSDISTIFLANNSGSLGPLAVEDNDVYLGRIRNSNLYVAMKCYNVTNDLPPVNIYFDFDYKYGALCTSVVHDIFITSCNNYTWSNNNTVYTTSGVYNDTIIGGSINGCDSITSLNLTINSVDTDITVSGHTISSNLSNSLYQWLDCNNNYLEIVGEINQTFSVNYNGSYAVEISQNGCADTSSCVEFFDLSIENMNSNYSSIYPNPSNGKFTMNLIDVTEASLNIFDISGKLIYYKKNINSGLNSINLDQKSGIYFVVLNCQGRISHFKLFIE